VCLGKSSESHWQKAFLDGAGRRSCPLKKQPPGHRRSQINGVASPEQAYMGFCRLKRALPGTGGVCFKPANKGGNYEKQS
jgi:hypothetical protein